MLRPLSLGEALDASLTVYRRLFFQLLGVSLATQAAPLVMDVFIEAAGGWLLHLGWWLLEIVLALVLGALGTAASTFIVSEHYLGRTVGAIAALGHARAYLGRLVALTFATGLMVGVGFVFFLVPGFILFSGLIVATPALVIENISTANDAMRRSWALSRGHRRKLLAAYLLAFLVLLVPTLALSWIAATTGMDGNVLTTTGITMRLIAALLNILIYPFVYVLTTILYYDLRVRKEGFDLEMLAATLQAA
jgi:hypothetical protein